MRPGSHVRPWTTNEVDYLVSHAGRITRSEICKNLKRSKASVRNKAAYLRRLGTPVDLRCFVSQLKTCPFCGALRSTIDRSGVCEPCRKQKQLTEVKARIAELYPLLSPEERALYDETEAELSSRYDPMPKAPKLDGLSHYRRSHAQEEYEIALEHWAIRNLNRRIKAAQKRKERIEKKIK